MERVEVTCPSCGVKLRLPAGKSGRVACPKCNVPFQVDTREPASGGQDNPVDIQWRDELIKSLSDVGVNQPPPPSKWRPIRTAILLSPLAFLAAFIQFWLTKITDSLLWVYSSAILTLISILLVGAVRLPLVRLWRQTRAQRAQAAIAETRQWPILYLRSFNVDAQIGRRSLVQIVVAGLTNLYDPPTPEERLARRFAKLGPVIAIGRPGEDMPALGAARFYVSHDRWQQKVADVVRVSQLVIWVSGVTEGLRWELSHLINSLPPTRLVLWAHPHLLNLSAAQREAEWRLFVERLGSLFAWALPEKLGEIRFFHFGPDFKPHPVRGNEYALVSSQSDAMKALLRAKGLVKAKAPGAWAWRSPSRIVQLLLGVIAGLLTGILLESSSVYFFRPRFVPADSAYACALSAIWGALFVLAQPVLRKAPGGYWGGGLLFGLVRKFVMATIITPVSQMLIAGRSRSTLGIYLTEGAYDFILILLFPLTLTDALYTFGWVALVMLLLRFLPWASGRPPRPDPA
jgi:hypothetical protein